MFRNICNFIPNEVSCTKLYEVQDDKIVEANTSMSLPCSNDYSLEDLLASGVKVAPVDPTVIHDSSATSAVADALVSKPIGSDDFVDNTNA